MGQYEIAAGIIFDDDIRECFYCSETVSEEYMIDNWHEILSNTGNFAVGYCCDKCFSEYCDEEYSD